MYKHLKTTLTLLVLTGIFLSLLSGCGTDSRVPHNTPPPVENPTDGSQVAPDAGDDLDLLKTPEPAPQPEEPSPLSISTSTELQEELYAAISEVRQPLPMEVSQMVWDQTPEIDIRNLYYELIDQHPELKYAYEITVELESGALTCHLSYMPHKTGNYPADWQGITVDTIPELIETAAAHLGSEPLNIRMTDSAMDPDQISYALQQVGSGYILCSLSKDGTQLIYSPAMGMTIEECLALLKQAEELAAEAAKKLIDDTMTKREQAETLYRYLTEYVQYDRRYYSDRANMPYDSQTAVGALRDGVAICGGYSHALKLLFEQAGIPCYTATGTFGGENHMWNIAYLDGHWLWFDATADRGLSPRFELRHFAQEELEERYFWDSTQLDQLLEEKAV